MKISVQPDLKPCRRFPPASASRLARRIAARRQAFDNLDVRAGYDQDSTYRYPVMAALVPVVTGRGGEVAYPGDPMCLYAALTSTIQRSVERRLAGLSAQPHLDDVYPDWGWYPDSEYRRRAAGPREGLIVDNPTTDGKVFDPRIWDTQSRERFIAELRALQPRVVLLSAVSAAHRYALEMAQLSKASVPGCVVILGGRHADETLSIERSSGRLLSCWSSTVEVIRDGRAGSNVDFIVSGDGTPCLDLLLQGISLVIEPEVAEIDTYAVIEAVQWIGESCQDLKGKSTIVGVGRDDLVVLPIEGRVMSRSELPSPYEAFAIRAHFDVFQRSESRSYGDRTAHMMTLDVCPFRCSFCSESIQAKTKMTRFTKSETREVVASVKQLVDWGAEAIFFDDPVFWGGSWATITTFCYELLERVEELRNVNSGDARSLSSLQWGAQLTVDVVLNRMKLTEVSTGLELMHKAGCTYIYIGIESMAESVMQQVHKNLLHKNNEPWAGKVRLALEKIKSHGIRAGSSVLFGLDGEDRTTIAETIEQIGRLIDDGLLIMASPNILTYHPGTAVSKEHGANRLDYHSRKENRPPYCYFEEAYPEVVSKLLVEDDIWYIHEAAAKRWGTVRNHTTLVRDARDLAPR